nr:YlqD family protein [Geobacillus sp. C56-T3]
MKLIQTVEVRQIVTERSKQELAAAFLARKQQLERECDQLRFEQKRMEKSGNYPPALVKQYFAKEIDERIETHISQPLHNIQKTTRICA